MNGHDAFGIDAAPISKSLPSALRGAQATGTYGRGLQVANKLGQAAGKTSYPKGNSRSTILQGKQTKDLARKIGSPRRTSLSDRLGR